MGRLDATNLFAADLALITSIGIDHTDWLGKDRESIAIEKAGIIHSGKIAVIADPKPPQSLLNIAREKAQKVYLLNHDYSYGRQHNGWWWKSNQKKMSDLPCPGLHGVAQINNLAGVLMCMTVLQSQLPVSDQLIRTVLPEIVLPGRYQVIDGPPQIILDVSHNPDSIALLSENLQQHPVTGKTHAVVAMMKDKDISESLRQILPSIDHWYFAGLSVSRGEKAQHLQASLQKLSAVSDSRAFITVERAWEHALNQVGDCDRIVVFGSFHTVGVILESLELNK